MAPEDLLTLGPELVVNGTFDVDPNVDWTASLGAILTNLTNQLRVTNGELNKGAAFNTVAIPLASGTAYFFKAIGLRFTSPEFVIQVGDGISIVDVNILSSVSNGFSQEFSVPVGYDCFILLGNQSSVTGEFSEFDDVSLRQILARRKRGAFPAARFPRRVKIGSKTYVVRDKRELDRLIRLHSAQGDL